jgi:protein-disulfide isomerase
VTIVEFGDYQCPFTGRVEATLAELRADYGDQIRIVYKDEPLPFHKRAEPAAEAALEVRAERGDAAFWSIHDLLLADQKDQSDATLLKLALHAGAHPGRVQAAIAKHTHQARLDADADLADDFRAVGTPHFFINGRRLVGSQPKEKFVALIDSEIQRAKALLVSGASVASLYDALTKDGIGAPDPPKKDATHLTASGPSRGPATAKVTIHEFGDYQCPFCQKAEETLAGILKTYGQRVRIVWHDLPLAFHANAPIAAIAGREAFAQKGATGFWALHDKMIADDKALERPNLDVAAARLGFDIRAWDAALDEGAHQTDIDADKKIAGELGISGTPAFVIVPAGATEGYFVNGAQPARKFDKLVDRALAEAR